MVSLGKYPLVSLAAAREKAKEHREQVAAGIAPAAAKRAERASRADTFEVLADEWLAQAQDRFARLTLAKARWILKDLVCPRLGSRPVAAIDAPEMLAVLRKIEGSGRHETAHRAKQRISQVLQLAVATGRAKSNPAVELSGMLTPVKVQHRASLTEPKDVGALLRAIDGYSGDASTEFALRLLPLTFVRPGELRLAEWSEFDLDSATWRIPGPRMKMREPHIVPLSPQAVDLLRSLSALTGSGRLLFPSVRSKERAISNNTLNAALRRLGYSTQEQTAHGFRTMASTLLHEQGYDPDVIELQLAHRERNKVSAAYNRAQRLDARRKMMHEWAGYLDRLKAASAGSGVIQQAANSA